MNMRYMVRPFKIITNINTVPKSLMTDTVLMFIVNQQKKLEQ